MGPASQLGFWGVAFPGCTGQRGEGGNNTDKAEHPEAPAVPAHRAGLSSSRLAATPRGKSAGEPHGKVDGLPQGHRAHEQWRLV